MISWEVAIFFFEFFFYFVPQMYAGHYKAFEKINDRKVIFPFSFTAERPSS